jgi:hypothetical protein
MHDCPGFTGIDVPLIRNPQVGHSGYTDSGHQLRPAKAYHRAGQPKRLRQCDRLSPADPTGNETVWSLRQQSLLWSEPRSRRLDRHHLPEWLAVADRRHVGDRWPGIWRFQRVQRLRRRTQPLMLHVATSQRHSGRLPTGPFNATWMFSRRSKSGAATSSTSSWIRILFSLARIKIAKAL